MSEHNYAGLLFKHQLEKHPEVFSIDVDAINKGAAKMRAERDAAAPQPGKEEFRKEYNQLRQTLFNLKQDAKCFEIRTNDAAGRIRLVEERINSTLKLKRVADAEGNLRGERTYEQAVQRLEAELTDAQEDFNKNKAWSGQAARALKAFDGHARIVELKALLETPLPEAKK